MLERTDFTKKQVVFLFANKGEKLSFLNDNLVIRNKDKAIKYQITCYRIFLIYVVGEISITSGLIIRAKKFGFVICLMNRNFRLYSIIGNRMEGNTLLHRKQYQYGEDSLAQFIVLNKVRNQRIALQKRREKTELCKEAIVILKGYEEKLESETMSGQTLLGIEGSAARVYFPQMFDSVNWKGRKPRIKSDYINTILDIGYSLLFNVVDSLLQVYGFDVYCGVYHKEFYMRKSLSCDMMEPIRPLIDLKVIKAINLNQFKVDDFQLNDNKWILSYKKSPEYVKILMEEILDYKEEMFLYIQSYYRSFMKGKKAKEYRMFNL